MKILLLLILCFALGGCYLYPKDWAEAETKCKDNGGIATYKCQGIVGSDVVTCNNKAIFFLEHK